jgi:hypothetical protein
VKKSFQNFLKERILKKSIGKNLSVESTFTNNPVTQDLQYRLQELESFILIIKEQELLNKYVIHMLYQIYLCKESKNQIQSTSIDSIIFLNKIKTQS